MALVRLTVPPSRDVAVVAEDHDADIVVLEVQRHAARAVLELDHLAGLDLVEAVDAGDAVADRQHAADLGDLGLGAEIGDLLLQDGGDLGGADVHQAAPFITRSSCCSLVRIEASSMREPTRTTSPPSRSRIDRGRQLRRVCPTAVASCCCTLSNCSGDSATAETTSAPTSPVVLGQQAIVGRDHLRQREQPPLVREQGQELPRQRREVRALAERGQRPRLVLARQHRAADQPLQIGALGEHLAQAVQIAGHAIQLVLFLGELEQGHGIATRQARRMRRRCRQSCSPAASRLIFRRNGCAAPPFEGSAGRIT